MSLLLESIKFEAGMFHNLNLHEQRMHRSLLKVLGIVKRIDLAKKLSSPPTDGRKYKCRVLYGEKIESVEYLLYKTKPVTQLVFIHDEQIRYPMKYADRSCFHKYTQAFDESTEIIFIQKKLLRDASYSNLAFFNGKEWHTPAYPLLKGTKREELLKSKRLISKKIYEKDLDNYSHVSFINAMNDLEQRMIALR
jgi:4-amino-4-deoxychorismate lyase